MSGSPSCANNNAVARLWAAVDIEHGSGERRGFKDWTDPMPLREPTPVIMQTLFLRR